MITMGYFDTLTNSTQKSTQACQAKSKPEAVSDDRCAYIINSSCINVTLWKMRYLFSLVKFHILE